MTNTNTNHTVIIDGIEYVRKNVEEKTDANPKPWPQKGDEIYYLSGAGESTFIGRGYYRITGIAVGTQKILPARFPGAR